MVHGSVAESIFPKVKNIYQTNPKAFSFTMVHSIHPSFWEGNKPPLSLLSSPMDTRGRIRMRRRQEWGKNEGSKEQNERIVGWK